MTPRRPHPKHTALILAALGSACLVLSGVSGLASLMGWLAAGIVLAAFVVVGAVVLVFEAIAARDIALDLPGAME